MKKSSKRIIVSVLTLVLTVVALTTTTFAWFSLSSVSSVNGITGEIMAGDGLEVALTNINTSALPGDFQNNLNESHFTKFMTNNASDFKFGAVTTKDNKKFTKLGMKDEKLMLGLEADGNKDFLEFKLTFRSEQAGTVKLTNYSFPESGTRTFEPEKEFQQTRGIGPSKNAVVTNASYGARLSFKTGDTSKAYQLGEEGNNNTANNTGISEGQWSFLDSKSVYIYDTNEAEVVEQVTNPGLYKMFTAETTIAENDQIVELVKPEGATHYVGKTIVRIWIEGWDADTYDSIFDLSLKVAMTFKKI